MLLSDLTFRVYKSLGVNFVILWVDESLGVKSFNRLCFDNLEKVCFAARKKKFKPHWTLDKNA